MNGVGDSTRWSLLRHSRTSIVKRYAHLSPSYLQDAVKKGAGVGTQEQQSHGEQGGSPPAAGGHSDTAREWVA